MPWKGTILEGNFSFQTSIFRDIYRYIYIHTLVFRGVNKSFPISVSIRPASKCLWKCSLSVSASGLTSRLTPPLKEVQSDRGTRKKSTSNSSKLFNERNQLWRTKIKTWSHIHEKYNSFPSRSSWVIFSVEFRRWPCDLSRPRKSWALGKPQVLLG